MPDIRSEDASGPTSPPNEFWLADRAPEKEFTPLVGQIEGMLSGLWEILSSPFPNSYPDPPLPHCAGTGRR